MVGARVEFANRWVELWNSGDYERWFEEVGPEFEFRPDPSFPDAGAYSGEELRRWMNEWIATWGENRFEMVDLEEEGNALLIRSRWHLATRQGGDQVPAEEFTMVLLYPDAEAERPDRMAAFFDREQARRTARENPG